MTHYLEKSISNLVKTQFPAFYQEEGPLFIEFVRLYYQWMESKTESRANNWISEKLSYVTVQSGNTSIVGLNTKFTERFSNGDSIAISRDPDTTSYSIYTINSISNNTFLVLNETPDFSYTKTKYTTVANTANPLYLARRFDDVRDIDTTFDEFLVYFKEKYLKGLQFINQTNTRTLVKHSLDLYRAKGTERAVELLFRIAYGITPRFYYPSLDLFRLSDGHWFVPTYIETSLNDNTTQFVNKEIKGLKSGATAFAESVIRRTVQGKMVDVIYVSAVNGTFETGELINTSDDLFHPHDCPKMIGSLNNVDIDVNGVGEGFEVGDILDITGNYGRQGKARVKSVSNTSGQVTFTFEDGGYGYSNNPIVAISNVIVTISNVVFTNTTSNTYYDTFTQLIQPLADINYISANGTFSNDALVYTYYANNLQKGTGRVLSVSTTNSTAGTLRVSVLSGNLNSNQIFTTSNVIGANLAVSNGYWSITATGNVIGIVDRCVLTVNGASANFSNGDTVYQYSSNTVTASGKLTGSMTSVSGLLPLSNVVGTFNNASPIYTTSNAAYCNLVSAEIKVGVKYIGANSFVNTGINYIYSPNSMANGIVSFVSSGAAATVTLSSNLLYSEYINVGSEYLSGFTSVALNATSYGMAGNTSGNATNNTMSNIIGWSNVQIGKLSGILSINKGTNYNQPPIIKILEPKTRYYAKKDRFSITLANTSNFEIDEYISQEGTGARGIVKSSSNDNIIVERLTFYDANSFIPTINSTTSIVGSSSGFTINVNAVDLISSSEVLGEDAEISTQLNIATGAITELEVIDSGFAYDKNETVTLTLDEHVITGTALVTTIGRGSGFYITEGGFASHDKKFFDGDYWQNYSYEIRSSKTLDKYLKMLKSVAHVAGTKPFGAMYYNATASVNVAITSKVTYAEDIGDLVLDRENNSIMQRDNTLIVSSTRT